ncbi:MAG: sensor histidine kinase [Gammaproteobacteria bacterium]
MSSLANGGLEGKSYRWLMDAAADAMFIVDRQGRILEANAAAGELFGYPCEELSSLVIEDLMPQRFREKHQAQLCGYVERPVNRAMGIGLEIYGLHQDGREFPIDVGLSSLGDGLFLATVRDIRAFKEIEESLATARLFAESIIDTIQEPLVVLDADHRVVSANRAFYKAFRLTPKSAETHLIFELHDRHWDTAEVRRLLSETPLTTRGVEAFELQIEVSDIGTRSLSVNARKLIRKPRERELILFAIADVTERKTLELEQTHLIHELKRANEELKSFAYIVSHDLKAPLRAIGSLAEWISSDQKERLDAEGREHLRLLLQRVRRMDALIDGVLQFSRIGRIHETVSAVNIKQLLDDIIDSLAPPANITITVAEGLPELRVERTRIQQVFQNLLSNAIRFMDKPEGRIRIDCEAAGDKWTFSVADNGPGIGERHFERIFQLFQTLNPRDRVESTGVGLAIVKKIVEMYGGRIWIESTVGEGSTFCFTLHDNSLPTSS